MASYILKRILLMLPTLFGITLITFMIIQLAPGDPASLKSQSMTDMLKGVEAISEVVSETKKLYGLDEPLYIQYGKWVKRIVLFDFGNSFHDNRPVMDKIIEALPVTLTLNILTIFIVYLISIPIGAYSAIKPAGFFDKISAIILFILYSLPNFWVAMMLILWLGGGEYLNFFPIIGFQSDNVAGLGFFAWIVNIAWHLVLPVLCLTYASFAFLSRFSRATMLDVIRQDYIKVAMAKGLPRRQVLVKHALRNALIPMLTLMGTLLPTLIAGSVIIEQIFALPGMGRLGFESVLTRDYPVIMAIATISALLTLVGILISDILYVLVDPRITFSKKA